MSYLPDGSIGNDLLGGNVEDGSLDFDRFDKDFSEFDNYDEDDDIISVVTTTAPEEDEWWKKVLGGGFGTFLLVVGSLLCVRYYCCGKEDNLHSGYSSPSPNPYTPEGGNRITQNNHIF